MARFCPKCGFENIDQTFYCSKCGAQIRELPRWTKRNTQKWAPDMRDFWHRTIFDVGFHGIYLVALLILIGLSISSMLIGTFLSDYHFLVFGFVLLMLTIAYGRFLFFMSAWKPSGWAWDAGTWLNPDTGTCQCRYCGEMSSESEYCSVCGARLTYLQQPSSPEEGILERAETVVGKPYSDPEDYLSRRELGFITVLIIGLSTLLLFMIFSFIDMQPSYSLKNPVYDLLQLAIPGTGAILLFFIAVILVMRKPKYLERGKKG